MYSLGSRTLALALLIGTTMSAPQYPIPVQWQCVEGDAQINYSVESQEIMSGAPQTGDYTVKGGKFSRHEALNPLSQRPGESLSQTSTFSVGTTVTEGVDVGLAKVASLGLSYSVSTTTTKSTTEGGTLTCPPGPWYWYVLRHLLCSSTVPLTRLNSALQIYPEVVRVQGEMTQKNQGIQPCTKVPQHYDVQLPVYGDSGNVRSRLEICSCGNFEHWADKGAPSLHCQDCAAPL